MIDIGILRKISCLERAGFSDAARHLRRLAKRMGIPLPPAGVREIDLPALAGLTADDLNALGVPWRRTDDGPVISVPAPRGGVRP